MAIDPLGKILGKMQLGDEEYDDDEYYDETDSQDVDSNDQDVVEEKPKKFASKVSSMKQSKKATGNGRQVCVIKPKSISECTEITDTLLRNQPVLLNLEGLNIDVAQRIIDYCSGSCYAISGNLQTVSNYIFIITPSSVEIAGDFQDVTGGSNSGPDII